MAMVEVSIVPVGTKTPSISQYVARALAIQQGEKDLKFEIMPMGTVIEGDLDRILALVARMHRAAFTNDSLRVVTTIKIDDRRDKTQGMNHKVEAVKKHLSKL